MSVDRILSRCWFVNAVVLVLSPMWHNYPDFWAVMAAVGGGMGFLSMGLHHDRVANQRKRP